MPITTILFDLDGTLLPMDQDVFVKAYFKRLAMKLAPLGYEPKKLTECIWTGTGAMIQNDGRCTNEEAFWALFEKMYSAEQLKDKPVFDAFYANEFQQVAEDCGFNPKAAQTIKALQSMGFRLALATNPSSPQWPRRAASAGPGLTRPILKDGLCKNAVTAKEPPVFGGSFVFDQAFCK